MRVFTFFTLLLGCCISMGFKPEPKEPTQTIAYFNTRGDFDALRATAKAQNKPFVLYFSMPECGACKKMDTTSLRDARVIEYLKQNYLAYKVDATSFIDDGYELAAKYDVHEFPTIMVFTPSGRAIYEIGGCLNAEILLGNLAQELHNYRQDPNFCPAHVAHFQPAATVPPVPESNIQYPRGFKFDVANQPNQEGIAGYIAPTTPKEKPKKYDPMARVDAGAWLMNDKAVKQSPSSTQEAVNIAGLYSEETNVTARLAASAPKKEGNPGPKGTAVVAKVKTVQLPKATINSQESEEIAFADNTISPKMATTRGMSTASATKPTKANKYELANYPDAIYGVQVGAFNDMQNLNKKLRLYEALGETTLIIQEATVNNQKVYKLIIGAFETRNEATQKIQSLETKGITGFVLGLSNFR